mmetsp:Transcript_95065/g.252484  ORF Transcript_95065/g.252484 Transcript_95065/m.252484 type:complete len:205 (+) Transcript_95065:135-749(+)
MPQSTVASRHVELQGPWTLDGKRGSWLRSLRTWSRISTTRRSAWRRWTASCNARLWSSRSATLHGRRPRSALPSRRMSWRAKHRTLRRTVKHCGLPRSCLASVRSAAQTRLPRLRSWISRRTSCARAWRGMSGTQTSNKPRSATRTKSCLKWANWQSSGARSWQLEARSSSRRAQSSAEFMMRCRSSSNRLQRRAIWLRSDSSS